MTLIEENSVVLFQGDSITDFGRDRNAFYNWGIGYAMITAAWFQALYPEKNVKFINRGISGDRAKDLQNRWKEDCLELKPDWVSILIGINDCWRRFDSNDPTTVEDYEWSYRDVLMQLKENTKARIILCEPFVLPVPEDRLEWREDLDPKIQVVRKLAMEFNALLVPLDGLFAEATAKQGPGFWAEDGVHPTNSGNALIAQAWLRTVKAI